jgi:hypothetical protein
MKNIFFILKGNNNSTYILNSASWILLTDSLKFFRTRKFKSKFLKLGLKLLLFINGKLWVTNLKNKTEIEDYIKSVVKSNIAFEINNNCSILISPTRDKVIVNHHENYFQKFAFGSSFHKAKNEVFIYSHFKPPYKYFKVSKQYDILEFSGKYCTFKLSNEKDFEINNSALNLVSILIEFYKVSSIKNVSVLFYFNDLLKKLKSLEFDQMENQVKIIETLKLKFENMTFPLGLVHRDFKPWNILNYDKPLIYDFEETIIDGPPLEDLFNYFIDPDIKYIKTKEVAKIILDSKKIKSYIYYLDKLNISIHYKCFLHIYLINRIIFWRCEGQIETSEKYLELSNYLIHNQTNK